MEKDKARIHRDRSIRMKAVHPPLPCLDLQDHPLIHLCICSKVAWQPVLKICRVTDHLDLNEKSLLIAVTDRSCIAVLSHRTDTHLLRDRGIHPLYTHLPADKMGVCFDLEVQLLLTHKGTVHTCRIEEADLTVVAVAY